MAVCPYSWFMCMCEVGAKPWTVWRATKGIFYIQVQSCQPHFNALKTKTNAWPYPSQVENKEVKKRILNDPVNYTEKFSENAKSICEGLLAKEVDKRMGFKNGTCDELRAHPFFSPINWRKLDAGTLKVLQGKAQVCFCSSGWTELTEVSPNPDAIKLHTQTFSTFMALTWLFMYNKVLLFYYYLQASVSQLACLVQNLAA